MYQKDARGFYYQDNKKGSKKYYFDRLNTKERHFAKYLGENKKVIRKILKNKHNIY